MKTPLAILSVTVLALFGGLVWMTRGDAPPQSAGTDAASTHGNALVGGDFSLTDQHGKPVAAHDFRGRVMVVFFGFTHCPDMCPMGVKNISDAMESLGDHAQQVAPIFISVDPERDDPAALRTFLANFYPGFVGLTGSIAQVEQATKAYKAYYEKAQPEDGGTSAINHSGFIYLMDKDGQYLSHLPYDAAPERIAAAVKRALP